MTEWKEMVSHQNMPHTAAIMQIHASYQYPPSLTSPLAPGAVLSTSLDAASRAVELQEASSLREAASGAELHACDMRQAVAWQLVSRSLMHSHTSAAAAYLKQECNSDDVRDVQVSRQLYIAAHEAMPGMTWE